MEKRGIEIIAPVMPKPNDPVMSEWLQEIDKTRPEIPELLKEIT